jgi:hypothetical protein
MEEENYSPYCPICQSCGEDGCCSATSCQHHPDGHYCKTYLAELKFGYIMYHEIMRLVEEDPKYKDSISKIWDKKWDIIFNKKEES